MRSLFVVVLTFIIMAATPASAMNHHLQFVSNFLHDRQVDGTLTDYEIDIYQDDVLITTIDPPAGSVFWPAFNGWRHVIATVLPYSDIKEITILLRHIPSGISGEMSNGEVYGDECWEWDFDANGVVGGSDYGIFVQQFKAGTATFHEYMVFRSYFGIYCN